MDSITEMENKIKWRIILMVIIKRIMAPMFNNFDGIVFKVTEFLCVLCGCYFSPYKLTALVIHPPFFLVISNDSNCVGKQRI